MGIMDDTECYSLAEVQEATARAFRAGEREERDRLRPLLERCVEFMEAHISDEVLRRRPAILADLRRELGIE